MFSSNYLIRDQVFIADYNAIIDLVRSSETFTCIGDFGGFNELFKKPVIWVEGTEYAAARALLAPAFSKALFPYYFRTMSRRSRRLWKELDTSLEHEKSITLEPVFQEHYMNVSVELTTGLRMDGSRAAHIRDLFNKVVSGFLLYRIGPLAKPIFDARDELLRILGDVIQKKIRTNREEIENLRSCSCEIDDFSRSALRKDDVLSATGVFMRVRTNSNQTASRRIRNRPLYSRSEHTVAYIIASGRHLERR